MKKILSVSILMVVLMCQTCMGAVIYPEYSVANKGTPVITERINIVFDNTGHDYVKDMFMDVMKAASFAENSDIWLYPIAGSVEPIKIEATKEFMDKYFTQYTKSSNEFKAENIVDKAIADLYADNTVSTKRFVLSSYYQTSELRSEYDAYGIRELLKQNPNLIFTSFSTKYCLENTSFRDYDNGSQPYSNYEGVDDKTFSEFLMIKYGYAECEAVYDKESGILKINKGQADNNIFITASARAKTFSNDNNSNLKTGLYLGGCMMDDNGLSKYIKGDKVSGVALSYNHISTDSSDNNRCFVSALFSTDGDCLNAAEEDLYVPLINAENVNVYYRSTRGVGTCSAETSYNPGQDKKVLNLSAPVVEETEKSNKNENSKELPDSYTKTEKQEKNVVTHKVPTQQKGIFAGFISVILAIIMFIVRLVFILLYIGIIAFIVGMCTSPKFRNYVHSKIIGTKLETIYDFVANNITKIISSITGTINEIKETEVEIKETEVELKGTVEPESDFIFISKASKDMKNSPVPFVIKELEDRGLECWLSEKAIKLGEDYNEEIPMAIKNCTMMVFFVSSNSIASSEVESEIGTAKHYKKIILPVHIEDLDLYEKYPKWAHMLKQYQGAELYKSSPELVKKCADSIEAMYNKLKKGTPKE